MDPRQIDLVQSSFAKVAPMAPAVARLFYGRLFEIAPHLRSMFRTDIEEQGRKLMTMLTLVVNSLRKIDVILPGVQMLAIRHVAYGVEEQHYEIVGQALLWTLEQGLDADFTPAVRDAWIEAYTLLSGAMIEAAYRVPATH
jgi:nitric oxide dioxygenase